MDLPKLAHSRAHRPILTLSSHTARPALSPAAPPHPPAPHLRPHPGWDLAWSRSFTPLVLQSAALILAPTYWTALDAGPEGLRHNPRSEEEYLQALIRTRASENECALVVRPLAFPPSLAFYSTSDARDLWRVVHQRRRTGELVARRPGRERRGADRRVGRVRAVQGQDCECGAFLIFPLVFLSPCFWEVWCGRKELAS